MRNIYILLIFGAACLAFGATARGQTISDNIRFYQEMHKHDPTPADAKFLIAPPDFTKISSYEEASRVVDAVVLLKPKPTPKYVDELVRQIRENDGNDMQTVFAIYLLGELHPTNASAVQVLIDKIDLKAQRMDPVISASARWSLYPAQEALGKQRLLRANSRASEAIVERLSIETDVLRRHLLCASLTEIEAKVAGDQQINRKLERETDPAQQANLRMALQEMEQIARYTLGKQGTLPQIGPTDKSVR